MNTLASRLQEMFDARNVIDRFLLFIPSLLAALIIVFMFWVLYRVARSAAAVAIRQAKLDPTAADFVQTILRYVILTIGFVTALGKVGVNTTSILTSLGVAGLTIGFAAKDALSNMISGIFIFWDRPFVLGDLVEVGGQYGRVESITMRSTRVVTPDGRMLAVPNTTVVNTTVASYTNFPHLRLDVPFTIAVTENLGRVRDVALSVCRDDDKLMSLPPAAVVVTELNDYNVALQLQVWLDDEKQHITARHALRERLFEALRDADVDMPYETLTLAPVEVRQGPPPPAHAAASA
ncbi:MAG: mechanosensitive ion channel family protein [Gemmatimonadaceae bacterium]